MIYGLTLESKGSGGLIILKVCCWLLTVIVFASPRKTIDISKRLCFIFWPVLTDIFNCSLCFYIDVNNQKVSTFVCFYIDVFTTADTLRVWAVQEINNNIICWCCGKMQIRHCGFTANERLFNCTLPMIVTYCYAQKVVDWFNLVSEQLTTMKYLRLILS